MGFIVAGPESHQPIYGLCLLQIIDYLIIDNLIRFLTEWITTIIERVSYRIAQIGTADPLKQNNNSSSSVYYSFYGLKFEPIIRE